VLHLKYAVLLALALSTTAGNTADAPRRIAGTTPLRIDGVGGVHIGMRFRQAVRLTGMKFSDPRAYDATDDTDACTFVTFRNGPKGLSFMLLHGVIARFDLFGKATNRTAEGVGIGTRERDIAKIYRTAKIEVAPSYYEGADAGHEITVTMPGHPGLRYFFATNLKKVVAMRIGRKSAVEYVEGCL
jgi:hypothetical protein